MGRILDTTRMTRACRAQAGAKPSDPFIAAIAVIGTPELSIPQLR
jgi:hypothetical protein